MMRWLIVAALVIGVATVVAQGIPTPTLPFTCDTFPPNTSADQLASQFGADHVRSGRVPWGGAEGDYNDGTILFGELPDARLKIFWRDLARHREPEWISTRGTSGRWRTAGGVTLGANLKAVEKINGRPFRLLGFATDVQGTVMSWSGGRLEAQSVGDCHIRVRFRVQSSAGSTTEALRRQVIGEKEFSSGHPAMQALNPTIYELLIQYGSTSGSRAFHPTAATQPRPASGANIGQRATYKPKSGDFVVVCTLYNGRAPGASSSTPKEPITYDPQIVLGARVERVTVGNSPWHVGELVTFLIHSPSLLLGDNYSGHQFALTFSPFRPRTKSDKVWFKPETRYVLQWIEPVNPHP